MKSKLYSFLFVLVLLVAAIWLINKKNSTGEDVRSTGSSDRSSENTNNRGFRRKVSGLEYSAHAKCRMRCRHITQSEVQDIMKNGTINYRKSDLKDKPCPTYAVEGFTREDNQHVRIVFAQCQQKTKVVTCIDLETDFACDCK